MTVKIRPVTSRDRTQLAEILRDTPEFKPDEVAVAEELIDCCLKDPAGSGYNVLIAEDGPEIAGYICYGPTPLTKDTWDMYWEAVARGRRGRGIGKALMDAAERAIREAGGRMIMIETSSTPLYENTMRFHLGCGYEIIGRVPDFYMPGDDKLILRKLLL